MKKSIFAIMASSVVLLASCGSTGKTPKLTNEYTQAKSAGNHAEYIDWQGLAANGDLPEWYSNVLNARGEGALKKALASEKGEYDNYRLWAVNAMGEDLDAIRTMTDSFDIQSAVSASIAQNVAQVADRQRDLEGPGSKITQESKAQVVDMITKNVTLNGLERITSYWAQYEIQNKKFVYVVGADNKVQSREIEVLVQNDGQNYVVSNGLKVGERIVIDGVNRLKNDMQINPITPAQAKAAEQKAKQALKDGKMPGQE